MLNIILLDVIVIVFAIPPLFAGHLHRHHLSYAQLQVLLGFIYLNAELTLF
jgi:hypothetical protein